MTQWGDFTPFDGREMESGAVSKPLHQAVSDSLGTRVTPREVYGMYCITEGGHLVVYVHYSKELP